MCRFIYWIVYILVCATGVCHSMTSWKMHALCGVEISREEYAGEVIFDAEEFQKQEHMDECTLTITPASLTYSDDRVLFYFTTFEQHLFCNAMNLTLKDGAYITDHIVQGLPQDLCDMNSSLTRQVFSTIGGSLIIKVSVKRDAKFHARLTGIFVFRFITYHKGSCSTHECGNGRCIPEVFNCSENTIFCDEEDDVCDDNEETFGDWLSKLFRYIFIIVGFICILCLLKVMLKKSKKKCEQAVDCFQDLIRDVRIKCRSCSRSINLSRCPKPRLPQFIRNRLRLNTSDREMSDNSIDTSNSAEAVTNPAFTDSSNQVNVHSPPAFHILPTEINLQSEPPSYEELMMSYPDIMTSSSQTIEHPPAYEEIMTPISETSPPQNFQYEEHSLNAEESVGNNTNEIELSPSQTAVAELPNDPIMSSNQIIQSSLQTDGDFILNDYLAQFGVELSDGYSTDPDWDSDRHEVHSVSNANIVLEEVNAVPPSSESDWDSDDYLSETQSEQTIEDQSVSNVNVYNEANDSDEDFPEPRLATNASVVVGEDNRVSTSSDWDSDGDLSVTQSEETIEAQSEPNFNSTVDENNPVPPPAYDDAVPPPYYYDYIANVSRYK